MPNILKVPKGELFWKLGLSSINVGAHANERIKSYIGDDAKYFAELRLTPNGYLWLSNETGWQKITAANSAQRAEIDAEIEKLRTRVRNRLSSNSKLAEEILSLPSDVDKYIFFKEDGNSLRFLIAGWGFSNSRRAQIIAPPQPPTPAKSLSAKIGFTIGGEIQPKHQFCIITVGGSQKHVETLDDGYYPIGAQEIGTKINIKDIASDKAITFEIEKDKEEYIFDVTRTATIKVNVIRDEQPLENATVQVSYHNADYTLTTNSQGEANVMIPYFDNETVIAKTGEVQEVAECKYPETYITFRLTTKKPEPPAPPKPPILLRVKCVNQNGVIKQNHPLSIAINEQLQDYITNAEGIICIPNTKVGDTIVVTNGFYGGNTITHTIESSADNELEYIVYDPVIEPINNLQMIGVDGQPHANKKVLLKQGEKSLLLTLDAQGSTQFKANEFEEDSEITAQILSPNNEYDQIPFTLESDERDYVIQDAEEYQNPWWRKLLNVVLALLLIYGLAKLGAIFVQYLPSV